jgi:hypothetical protein
MPGNFRSIVDVLDGFFGSQWTPESADSLSPDDLHALATDTENFYSIFKLPEREASHFRSYSGGATFAANMRSNEIAFVPTSGLLPFAHAATLYADQIVVDCPLDAWIYSYRGFPAPSSYSGHSGLVITPLASRDTYGRGFWNADEDENRVRIKTALARLGTLAPAIRSGWILPVPHLRIWRQRTQQILTQVRRDVMNLELHAVLRSEYKVPPALSDEIRGLTVMPSEGVVPKDAPRALVEAPANYFNSVMAVADATDSRFLATADSDYELLRQKISDAGKLNGDIRRSLAVHGLQHVFLPTFDSHSFATICEIRNSEPSFADWREGIRALTDGDLMTGNVKLSEYQSMAIEKLQGHVNRIRKDVEKSRSLRGKLEAAKPDALDVSIAAVIWSVPPQASVLKLTMGVAAPLLRRAILSVASPTGSAKSVVMKLDKR